MTGDGFRFGAVSTKAIRDHRVSDAELRVLAELSTYADADGWCEPKQSTMADHLGGVTRQAISKHLRRLVDLGHVGVEEQRRDDGGRRSNRYFVRMDPATSEVAGGATVEVAGAATSEVAARTDQLNRPVEQNPSVPSEPPGQATLVDVPKTPRKRNPVYDALAAVYPSSTKSERSLIGMAAAELRELRPVPEPEEIIRRARAALREWPGSTPRAVAQHWTMLGEKLAGGLDRDPLAKFDDEDDDYADRKRRLGSTGGDQ